MDGVNADPHQVEDLAVASVNLSRFDVMLVVLNLSPGIWHAGIKVRVVGCCAAAIKKKENSDVSNYGISAKINKSLRKRKIIY